jgi:hypothetical protein
MSEKPTVQNSKKGKKDITPQTSSKKKPV